MKDSHFEELHSQKQHLRVWKSSRNLILRCLMQQYLLCQSKQQILVIRRKKMQPELNHIKSDPERQIHSLSFQNPRHYIDTFSRVYMQDMNKVRWGMNGNA